MTYVQLANDGYGRYFSMFWLFVNKIPEKSGDMKYNLKQLNDVFEIGNTDMLTWYTCLDNTDQWRVWQRQHWYAHLIYLFR